MNNSILVFFKSLPTKATLLKFFLLLLIPILIISSCSKTNIDSQDEILNAKNWFEKNYSNPNEFNKEFSNIDFDWSKAKIVNYGNNYKTVIVPLKNKKITTNYVGMSSLIVFPAKNGGYFHRIFTAFPELNYLKEHHYKLNKNDFTGVASYWDLKKGFVRGAYTKNGQYFSTLNIVSNQNSLTATSIVTDQTLPSVTVYSNSGGNINYSQVFNTNNPFNLGMGDATNPCEYGGQNTSIFDGLPIEFFQNLEYFIILNQLQNPCLKNLFETLKNNNLLPMLNSYTGGEKNLIIGNGSSTMPSNNPGTTGPGNDASTISILLNENLLINSTYEAATETIIHEAIHAYFFSNVTNPDEFNAHISMLENFAVDMITRLQTQYPNLDYFAAASLVYGGFNANSSLTPSQLTIFNNSKNSFFNKIYQHEAATPNGAGDVTVSNLNFIAEKFHNGQLGTKFPTAGCP